MTHNNKQDVRPDGSLLLTERCEVTCACVPLCHLLVVRVFPLHILSYISELASLKSSFLILFVLTDFCLSESCSCKVALLIATGFVMSCADQHNLVLLYISKVFVSVTISTISLPSGSERHYIKYLGISISFM